MFFKKAKKIKELEEQIMRINSMPYNRRINSNKHLKKAQVHYVFSNEVPEEFAIEKLADELTKIIKNEMEVDKCESRISPYCTEYIASIYIAEKE
jgi:hypothetical protein